MGLVDYASSDNDSDTPRDEQAQPPAKKPRISASASASASAATPKVPTLSTSKSTLTTTTTTTLPPLPPSFHNLYATTVRPFTADLPSLHQGRKRLIPHVDGNWPSHIYVEWHPTPAHHDLLCSLIRSLQTDLLGDLEDREAHHSQQHQQLTSFLTSDLGAPLPLHISLSRPFVLRTEQKDAFRDALTHRIASVRLAPFELRIADGSGGLAWFRSPEASRSFLVLRVRAAQAQYSAKERANPQLATLLTACNEVVAAQGQPRLYAHRGGDETGVGQAEDEHEEEEDDDVDDGGGVRPVDDDGEGVDGAFHVSVAWSFAEPTDEIRARTAAVFAREVERRRGEVGNMRILVDSVKVKIGNVITDIPLTEKGGKGNGGRRRALFGI